MLKLNKIEDAILSETGKFRIHAKKAMFATDPVQKEFHQNLAANAQKRAFALEDAKNAPLDFAV